MGYRIVRMSRELFEQMFVEGYTLPTQEGQRLRCTKGLPEGARLDAVSMDLFFDSYGIALRFYHPDWPDQPGYAIPIAPVEYTMELMPTAPQFKCATCQDAGWINTRGALIMSDGSHPMKKPCPDCGPML